MQRKILMLTMMVALALLPGLATAIPTDYTVNSGGSLSIEVAGTAQSVTPTRMISLGSGSFTFDDATGRVTNLRLVSASGHVVAGGFFDAPFSAPSTTNSNRIVLGGGIRTLTFDFTVSPVVQNPNPGPVAVNPVPEPTAALLFASGVGVVGFVGNRRRRN